MQGGGAQGAAVAQAAAASPSDADGACSGRIGFLEGIGCHVVWGLMPVYWKLLSAVPALEVAVVAHGVVVRVRGAAVRVREAHAVPPSVSRPARPCGRFWRPASSSRANGACTCGLPTAGTFWKRASATTCARCATSRLAWAVFKERLTPMQKLATALAAVGVTFFIVTQWRRHLDRVSPWLYRSARTVR